MKKFEKWWKEYYDEPRYVDNCVRYSASKAGWRAAMKQALIIASLWRKCGIETEIEEAIEKELNS